MTALQLVQWLTAAVFAFILGVTLVRFVRRPIPRELDLVLFFAAPSFVLVIPQVLGALGIRTPTTFGLILIAFLLAMPLLTLRAVAPSTELHRWALPAAFVGWIVSAVALGSGITPLPLPLVLAVIAYFAGFEGYAGVMIALGTRKARGVARRRLQLIAAGTASFALAILVAGFAIVLPVVSIASLPLALLSGLLYLFGFAPPALLRRAWQAPTVYAFIQDATDLAAESDAEVVLTGLARTIARVIGSSTAALGIWDGARERLVFSTTQGTKLERTLDESLSAESFVDQRPTAIDEAVSDRRVPDGYRLRPRHVVLSAPITVGADRIGVVSAISERSAIFTDDDLALLQLLAQHAGVVIENRRLYDRVKTLNADLSDRVRELDVVNAELGAFSYSVSHDLRAPLRSIDGFSQIVLEDHGDDLGPQGREYLGKVRAATTRMGQLIDDLLKLSRVTRDEMRRERLDLGQIATSIVADLRAREPDRAVEFTAESGVGIEADARLMRVALTNLLENAWKFTRQRSPAHLALRASTQDKEITFALSDDGAGFDMTYSNKLFGAFQRLHGQGEFEGTGIGLATVKRIVHRHGGRVWAEGTVGKGATFYFTLPVHVAVAT